MATRFTLHKNGKPVAPARKVWGDAYVDLRQTSIVPVWPVVDGVGKADPAKDDPGAPVTQHYSRGFSIVVTR